MYCPVLKRFSDFEALHYQWVAPTMPRAAPLSLPSKSVSVTGLAASLAAGFAALTGGGGDGSIAESIGKNDKALVNQRR